MSKTKTVSVVIPYYQKQQGILVKSINSILAQDIDAVIKIIVVDDGSPVSADSELANLVNDKSSSISIIHQSNQGPAGARNRGLDAVPDDTDFIAFLDSDDEWTPNHLSSALTALGDDYDFYFSDFYQLEQSISAFTRAGRINPENHPKLLGSSNLHQYQGDLFDQVRTQNISFRY